MIDTMELYFFLFFFFSSRRRHTRCLSDWSSDVCSSDLSCGFGVDIFGPGVIRCTAVPATSSGVDPERLLAELIDTLDEEPTGDARYHRVAALVACHSAVRRSEERRVGKECRSQWSPYE